MEAERTGGKLAERIGAGAEIVIGVAQFAALADHGDREVAGTVALADAGVENGRFIARVGADDQQRVGAFDA